VAELVDEIGSIGDQTAAGRIKAVGIDRGQAVSDCFQDIYLRGFFGAMMHATLDASGNGFDRSRLDFEAERFGGLEVDETLVF
jgi:hypothetical protein